MTIVAGGFDHDGCLNKAAGFKLSIAADRFDKMHTVENRKALFKGAATSYCCRPMEHPLIKHFSAKVKKHSARQVVVMSSSARQNSCLDSINMKSNGKFQINSVANLLQCFTENLVEAFAAPLFMDTKLLGDICSSRKAGAVFSARYAGKSRRDDHVITEKKKFLLLYMQCHRLAARYPTEPIHFYFYDDRIVKHAGSTHPSFGQDIYNFFRANADLLPRNLVLHLCQYGGASAPRLPFYWPLQGRGDIDIKHDGLYLHLYNELNQPANESHKKNIHESIGTATAEKLRAGKLNQAYLQAEPSCVVDGFDDMRRVEIRLSPRRRRSSTVLSPLLEGNN
jgi:hypothetical protein